MLNLLAHIKVSPPAFRLQRKCETCADSSFSGLLLCSDLCYCELNFQISLEPVVTCLICHQLSSNNQQVVAAEIKPPIACNLLILDLHYVLDPPPTSIYLWRSSYPSLCHLQYVLLMTSGLPHPHLPSAFTPPPHNSPVQHSAEHAGQDSAEVIKPHLSAGSVRRLQIYPISLLLMPGSRRYDSGWLTEPPVVTRSSSRSHYQVVLLANEFVSNHVICKCLTQLWVKHAAALPTGTKIKRLSVGFFSQKTTLQIHIFCGWFGSLFQTHLIGILIGTVLKQLSDENHLDFIFIIYSFSIQSSQSHGCKLQIFSSSHLKLSFTYYLPPSGWLLDLLTFDHKCYMYVIKLLKLCSSSIVLIALQILPQRNKNRITLRSNLRYTHQLLSRSTSRLIQKGQIISWMSGCCTP